MSDEFGLIDFGEIQPGSYNLALKTPWNESLRQSLFVPRGQALTKEFVCSEQSPMYSKAYISIKWPEDLREKEIWAMCFFEAKRQTKTANWYLELENPHYTTIHNTHGVIVDSPHSSELSWSGKSESSGKLSNASYVSTFKPRLTPPSFIKHGEYSPISLPHFPKLISEVSRIVGKHHLSGIDIVIPSKYPPHQVSENKDLYKLEIIATHDYFQSRSPLKQHSIYPSLPDDHSPSFNANPNEDNTWTIELPEELLTQVRTYLKENESPLESAAKPNTTE